ncbi:MAG: flagellar hook-basal body protein [Thermodesulfobacteriota bacterium]|nr:flagellar hook-basal body protein [Thermodesulfobacteriota bacterium]
MTSASYTLIDAFLTQQNRFNTISNNLANINTNAFKKDSISFNQTLSMENISITDFSPGPLQYTGNRLDVALGGQGFYKIQTPRGIEYTRNGAFSLNGDRLLVTKNGDSVLGKNGPIKIAEGNVSIGSDGIVTAGNQTVDTLVVVNFKNPRLLKKGGESYYRYQGDVQDVFTPENISIQQGYIEGSNVNPTEEMIKMIEIMRVFEATQKAMQSMGEATDKMINDVGILQ